MAFSKDSEAPLPLMAPASALPASKSRFALRWVRAGKVLELWLFLVAFS